MKNAEIITQCTTAADVLLARHQATGLSYHEQLAYNDLRKAAENLTNAEAKAEELAKAEAARVEEARQLVAKADSAKAAPAPASTPSKKSTPAPGK